MTLPAQAESRRRNLGAVLRLVHERGATRQVDISDALELTRSTGNSLVDELVALGLVVEGTGPARRGRPSPVIEPNPNVAVVTAEIAAAACRVDVVSLGGTLLMGCDVAIAPASLGPKRTLRRVANAIAKLLGDTDDRLRIAGSAIAVHGAVDAKRQIVFAPNLQWTGADVGNFDTDLREALGQSVPTVLVGNDANMGALGELRRGAGRGRQSFLYLSAERGVGGAVVTDGDVSVSPSGLAGEVGHMKIGAGTHVCACGQRGCWETEIGAAAFERGATDETAASWLGRGLGALIPVLQPEIVIVNGHLARLAVNEAPTIKDAIAAACPPQLARDTPIVPSELGADAALIGAAELAFERLLADPAAIG